MSLESLVRFGIGEVGTKPRPLESADSVAWERVLLDRITKISIGEFSVRGDTGSRPVLGMGRTSSAVVKRDGSNRVCGDSSSRSAKPSLPNLSLMTGTPRA